MSIDCYVVDQKLVCVIGDTNVDPYYGRGKSSAKNNKPYYDIEIHLFNLDKQNITGDPFESTLRSRVDKNNYPPVVRVYEHHAGSYKKVENYLNGGYMGTPKIYLLE
jgi:hypothetical protein